MVDGPTDRASHFATNLAHRLVRGLVEDAVLQEEDTTATVTGPRTAGFGEVWAASARVFLPDLVLHMVGLSRQRGGRAEVVRKTAI